jgi:hypothetical protein
VPQVTPAFVAMRDWSRRRERMVVLRETERIIAMRNVIAKSFVAAAVTFSVAGAAQAAAVVQESSSAYQPNTSYIDIVLHYSSEATVPLTVQNLLVEDVTGAGVGQQTQSCPGFNKAVNTYTLQPGQFCWVRAFPTGDGLAGKAELSDSTANANNINKFVRTSMELRDGNNNTILHVELH